MKLQIIPRHQSLFFQTVLGFSLVVILYLATVPLNQPLPGGLSDKFWHGLCFVYLAFLGDNAFPERSLFQWTFAPLFLYGVLIEIIQFFIPYRSFSLADMVADALGLAVYGGLMLLSSYLYKNLPRHKA